MEEVTKLFVIEIKKMEKFCWLNPLFSQRKLYVRIKHTFSGPISYKQRPPPLGQFHTDSSSALELEFPITKFTETFLETATKLITIFVINIIIKMKHPYKLNSTYATIKTSEK